MPQRHKELAGSRQRIDEIDEQILDLLAERAKTVQEVIRTKVENQLPVFIPEREHQKSEAFKKMAEEMRKNEEKFNEEDNKKTSE